MKTIIKKKAVRREKDVLAKIRKDSMGIAELSSLKCLCQLYYKYQYEQIMINNTIGKKKNKETIKGGRELDDGMLPMVTIRLKEIENQIEIYFKAISIHIHKHPLWINFLSEVKGCGELISAVIISEIDINRAVCVSNLWSYAGLAPGKDKKVKGHKCTFNQNLRNKLCGVLGSSFLKSNSPYRKFYDDMKNRLQQKNWGMDSKNPVDESKPKAGHQHNAANRYMIKMFLKDLYIAWRTLEGLEVRKPYEEEYLNRKHTDKSVV